MNEPIVAQVPRKQPRLRISVRALMAVVLVLAVWLGYYVRSVHTQQDAVAAIQRAGGSVEYDWKWGNYNPDILDYDGKWRAPKWLARLVPVDYVANVLDVSLIPQTRFSRKPSTGRRAGPAPPGVSSIPEKQDFPKPADDSTLAHVGRLPRLRSLRLDDTAITDAGMVHLEKLENLLDIQLDRTNIGDAGLAHLHGLKGLRMVWISGTPITDEGVLDLERALPNVTVYRIEEMADSNASARAMNNIDFALGRPIRLAIALLVHRAWTSVEKNDMKEFTASVDALCDLETDTQRNLIRLAEARAEMLGYLESQQTSMLSPGERARLHARCAGRAMEALTRAVDMGYDNLRRILGKEYQPRSLWGLRHHPDFAALADRMKAMSAGR